MAATFLSRPRALSLAIALLATSTGAFAGGTDLPTIVASHQGTSNANGAEAADPSVMYYNPAGLARLKGGLQVSQGFSALLFTGKVKVDPAGTTGTAATNDDPTTPGVDESVNGNGRQLTTSPNSDGPAGSYWPRILGAGGLFASMPIDDMVTAGIGIFAPGGGNLNYKSNWAGAYQIDSIAIEMVNINPSIGIRFDEQHSLGLGVSVLGGHVRQRVQIDVPGVAPYLLKSAVDSGNTPVPSPLLAICNANNPLTPVIQAACGTGFNALGDVLIEPGSTGSALVEMYGYGFGFNAGYMFALNDYTRFGLAYRSKSVLNMRGDLTWNLDNIKFRDEATLGQVYTGAFGSPTLKGYLENNLRPDTTAKGEITLPARISANVFHQLTPMIDLMADFTFIQSSVVKRIEVDFLDVPRPGMTPIRQGSGGLDTNWRDSFKASVGANYRLDDKLMLRTGFQFDKTPVPSPEFRHPGLPDSDRYMFSVGANYKVKKNLTIDAAYSLVALADAASNYKDRCRATNFDNPDGSYNPNGDPCTSNGGTFKGTFTDTFIHILSAQLNQRF